MKAHSLYIKIWLLLSLALSMTSVSANTLSGSDSVAPTVQGSSNLMAAPVPPICNRETQALYWNGAGWECIDPPKSEQAGVAPGTMIGMCTVTNTTRGKVFNFTVVDTSITCNGVLSSAGPCSYSNAGGLNTCIGKPAAATLCSNSNGKMSGNACYSK